ncbi:unnamed protein product [Taenia asiatica]|uniref:Pecanex-like protein n=1 Tax=Taenia asiatica TaxID=60517 RepID=A0A0R3VT08_TAEAS|nr:unnamed protein product [Taenia asiatica]
MLGLINAYEDANLQQADKDRRQCVALLHRVLYGLVEGFDVHVVNVSNDNEQANRRLIYPAMSVDVGHECIDSSLPTVKVHPNNLMASVFPPSRQWQFMLT